MRAYIFRSVCRAGIGRVIADHCNYRNNKEEQ